MPSHQAPPAASSKCGDSPLWGRDPRALRRWGTVVRHRHCGQGRNAAIKVIGVEPAKADDATRTFKTGKLCTVHNPDTIADGARTPSLGKLTFELVRKHVDDMVTVSEEQIVAAMFFLWERLKLVIEPTGAVAFAALHAGVLKFPGLRIGVILSGGNVDFAAIKHLL